MNESACGACGDTGVVHHGQGEYERPCNCGDEYDDTEPEDGAEPSIHSLLPTVTQAMYYVAACGSTDLAAQIMQAKYELADAEDALQLADEAYELLFTMVPSEITGSPPLVFAYHVLRVALIDAVVRDSTGLIIHIQKEINKLLEGVL